MRAFLSSLESPVHRIERDPERPLEEAPERSAPGRRHRPVGARPEALGDLARHAPKHLLAGVVRRNDRGAASKERVHADTERRCRRSPIHASLGTARPDRGARTLLAISGTRLPGTSAARSRTERFVDPARATTSRPCARLRRLVTPSGLGRTPVGAPLRVRRRARTLARLDARRRGERPRLPCPVRAPSED